MPRVKSKKFNCDICKKNFWSPRGMHMHARLKHKSNLFDIPILFTNAPQDRNFQVVDGTVLKNIWELAEKLEMIEEWAFRHHVNEERNDFAKWIDDIFEDKNLSTRISQHTDKKDLQITLLKEIISNLRK